MTAIVVAFAAGDWVCAVVCTTSLQRRRWHRHRQASDTPLADEVEVWLRSQD
jgi:hypothetical protein